MPLFDFASNKEIQSEFNSAFLGICLSTLKGHLIANSGKIFTSSFSQKWLRIFNKFLNQFASSFLSTED